MEQNLNRLKKKKSCKQKYKKLSSSELCRHPLNIKKSVARSVWWQDQRFRLNETISLCFLWLWQGE